MSDYRDNITAADIDNDMRQMTDGVSAMIEEQTPCGETNDNRVSTQDDGPFGCMPSGQVDEARNRGIREPDNVERQWVRDENRSLEDTPEQLIGNDTPHGRQLRNEHTPRRADNGYLEEDLQQGSETASVQPHIKDFKG